MQVAWRGSRQREREVEVGSRVDERMHRQEAGKESEGGGQVHRFTKVCMRRKQIEQAKGESGGGARPV